MARVVKLHRKILIRQMFSFSWRWSLKRVAIMPNKSCRQRQPLCGVFGLLGAAFLFLSIRPPFSILAATEAEKELTPAYLGSIESKLSDFRQASQLDLYDRLIYGNGDFVRVEGKSRRYLIVSLDSSGHYFARLFDVPDSQLREASTRRPVYFTGVCSKIESPSRGIVEVTVTYSLLTSTVDRIFTIQAQTYARRAEEARKKNQVLLARADGMPRPAAASPQSAPSAGTPQLQAPSSKTSPADVPGKESQSTSSRPLPGTRGTGSVEMTPGQSDDDEEDQGPEGARPRLIRRGSPPKESQVPASTSPASTKAPAVESIQAGDEQDTVIYRRPKSSSPSKGLADERAEPTTNRSSISLSPALQSSQQDERMVLIPAGFVTMGSDDPNDSEKPVHRVKVESFYLDKYEVTNQEYKEFCDATGRLAPPHWIDKTYPKGLDKHPVTEVSWQDAAAYARWAGKRLPTEAEWERAAKGPNATRYAYGNTYDSTKANTETRKTTPVGSYPPAGFSAFDLTGNVAEWTSSLFKPYPYNASDGREEPGAAGPRVVRGGHHSSGVRDSRCLVRTGVPADRHVTTIGFRCARDAR